MDHIEAVLLADTIARDPQFHIDQLAPATLPNGQERWQIRFTILYSNSVHWINSQHDWEWVKRNLTWHPKGGWTPESETKGGTAE